MTWFRVDDEFHDHPKVVRLSDAAVALWVKAGAWSARHGTDGFVPKGALPVISGHRTLTRSVRELCTADGDRAPLWEAVEGGYQFHDWDDYQTPGVLAEARREAHAEAQKAYRARQSALSDGSLVNHVTGHGDQPRDGHVIGHVTGGDASRDDHVTDHASRARAAAPAPPIPIGTTQSSSVTGSSARATPTDDDGFDLRGHDQPRPNGFVDPKSQQAAIVMAQVRESTGTVIRPEAAAAIRDDIIGGRTVRDTAGYLRSAILAEARRDPALTRWLAPARGGRSSPRAAPDVLADAAEGRSHTDPDTAHRGADTARKALDSRPKPPAPDKPAGPPPPPTDPASLRAAQRAAADEAPPEEPPVPDWPPDPPDDGDDAADMEVPF